MSASSFHAMCSTRLRRWRPARESKSSFGDNHTFDVQDVGNVLNGSGMVSHAQGEMMRRTLGHPAGQEGADVRLEEAARIRIAGGRNAAVY